jgi:acyl-CoA thioester hydrolase
MSQNEKFEMGSGFVEEGTHVFLVRVYYEDTDFTGIVYHAGYLHFIERGRTEWLRHLGVSHRELGDGIFGEKLAFAIKSISIDYATPARVDDVLAVWTSLVELKGARMVLDQRVMRGAEQVASAKVEVVVINSEGRPRRVPDEMRRRIEQR